MMPAMSERARLIWKKSCDTCRRFKAALDAAGADYEGRELNAEPMTAEELSALIGGRDFRPYLNTHNEVYRREGLGRRTIEREEAIALIAGHNNLLRRPIVVLGQVHVVGNDLKAAKDLLGLP